MYETLADAIDALSAPGHGFYFTSGDDPPSFVDYRKLRERVQILARKLLAIGGGRREPAILLFTDQAEFVHVFLAALRAGLVAVPVHPPYLIGNLGQYATRVGRVCRITGSRLILTSDALVGPLQPFFPDVRIAGLSELDTGSERGELPRIQSSDAALIQFTSGSTAAPRGAALTHRNLISNAVAIAQALELDPHRDRGVSWLPMHHDMGLIGFLVTPILIQGSNWYLPPSEFARRPHRWLDLLSETRATISFSPTFGYDLVVRGIREANTEKWNLESWRVAGCGGEPILARPLNRFAELLLPAGFRRSAFVPCYGLAEATLAVTISPLQRGIVSQELAGKGQTGRLVVSSGRVVTGTEVRVVSVTGNPVSDGVEGEIQVRGRGVAKGFWNDSGLGSMTCEGGWLKTGDLGVLSEGELYVSGRIKEVIFLNGQNCYPQDIEECIQDVEGVRCGNAVAFGRPGASSEQLVLVVEAKQLVNTAELRRRLRTHVRKNLGLNVAEVVIVGRGVISRTTSGKLRRQAMRTLYLSGDLPGDSG